MSTVSTNALSSHLHVTSCTKADASGALPCFEHSDSVTAVFLYAITYFIDFTLPQQQPFQ